MGQKHSIIDHLLDEAYTLMPNKRGNERLCLQDVAMNGCSGVTGNVWQHINAASSASAAVVGGSFPQHALQSLSLVGCKGMRTCLLGLKPAAGWDVSGPGRPVGDWLPAACHLSGISLTIQTALDLHC